jgi:citrate lyase beta subunit
MAGKIPNKFNDGEKKMVDIITIPMEDAVALAKAILTAEDVEEAVVDLVEEKTIVSI